MTADSALTYAQEFPPTPPMPVLFVGHGNPMNAIEESDFSRGWSAAAATLHVPRAILCISAHWETRGTHLTAMVTPPTIHDFYGFPPELFAVTYPAPGSPDLVEVTRSGLGPVRALPDLTWGLDHGSWSVLRRMYPRADIPVVQMSLDTGLRPADHAALGRELQFLRTRGILIIGSGNIVHNLRLIDWQRRDAGHDWAESARETIRRLTDAGDIARLASYDSLGEDVRLAIPTPEHYLPLLYVLALRRENEPLTFFNDRTIMGSLAMTSVRIG
jgi:4,5-DOPA dioxygenase extradiol